MGNPQPISATELARLRDEGELVCRCALPEPTPVWLFATVQCQRCLRPILRHTQQQG